MVVTLHCLEVSKTQCLKKLQFKLKFWVTQCEAYTFLIDHKLYQFNNKNQTSIQYSFLVLDVCGWSHVAVMVALVFARLTPVLQMTARRGPTARGDDGGAAPSWDSPKELKFQYQAVILLYIRKFTAAIVNDLYRLYYRWFCAIWNSLRYTTTTTQTHAKILFHCYLK